MPFFHTNNDSFMKTSLFKHLLYCGVLLGALLPGVVRAQESKPKLNLQPDIQYFRYYDQRALGVFETPKEDSVEYNGFAVRVGANFTLQYQNLQQSNNAPFVPYPANTATNGSPGPGVSQTQLISIAGGLNLATANLNLDAQLADGIRVNVIAYLSSRHHSETWVKGGYVQVDKLTFLKSGFIDNLMKNLTIKFGHYEINYGDGHYRRSDNGNAIQNPFVDGLLLDAFTTEVGGELVWQKSGFIVMGGVTDGAIQGGSVAPTGTPSYLGKLGYDKKLTEDLRVRLTGSIYTTQSSFRNTLYGGDRTGVRYYYVMTPLFVAQRNALPTFVPSDPNNSAFNGRVNPGFSSSVTSFMVNPFIKWKGLEFFGTFEASAGTNGTAGENNIRRTVMQYSGELIYRFLKNEQLFVGARYNTVSGQFLPSNSFVTTSPEFNAPPTLSANRIQVAAGWFLTKNILLRAEYVTQSYSGYDNANLVTPSILNGARFNGIMIEGAIGF
jgi:hypothetical protein